jgi:hypothetical protein
MPSVTQTPVLVEPPVLPVVPPPGDPPEPPTLPPPLPPFEAGSVLSPLQPAPTRTIAANNPAFTTCLCVEVMPKPLPFSSARNRAFSDS